MPEGNKEHRPDGDATATIEAFTHRKVVVLHQDTPSSSAARAICDNRIGCVVVADHDGHIVGILTDRDLVCGLLAYRSDIDAPILEFMTSDPATVDENASVEDVLRVMEENGVRRIPVIRRAIEGGGRARCVGIVTLDDLIASQSVDYIRVGRIVQAQLFRRGRIPSPGLRRLGAGARSQAHMEQTVNRFHKTVGDRIGADAKVGSRVAKVVLESLVRRLHFTGSAHLIAQLPKLLQEDLLDLPAGPDRRITADAIVSRLREELGLSEDRARAMLRGFFEALSELIDRKELDHLRAQLPQDLQIVCPPPAVAA